MDGALRELSFADDATDEVLACWRGGEFFLRSSPSLSLLDGAPLARFGLEGSDADGEGEGEDSMDKAQKIW